jgi:hypothetical protein
MRMARRQRVRVVKEWGIGANEPGAKTPSTSAPRRLVLVPSPYILAPRTIAPRSRVYFLKSFGQGHI